jgi:hypothetical protein
MNKLQIFITFLPRKKENNENLSLNLQSIWKVTKRTEYR